MTREERQGMSGNDKFRILFVCLGNICRSPAAEGILSDKVAARGLTSRFVIDSAGTYGGHAGDLPDPRMRVAASHRGYCLGHRARQIRENDFERFDRIIVMDDSNYERVCRLAPDVESLDKVYRMRDFCRRFEVDYVPDPYYEGQNGFEYVLDILEDACEGLLEELIAGERS